MMSKAEMTNSRAKSVDIAVIGGGLVGVAMAYGLSKPGVRVALLDEGDTAVRASRGNFALVWVQAKGLGMPEYADWTVASSDAWAGLAADLKSETELDVKFDRPGGFHLCLSDAELEARRQTMQRFYNQGGRANYATEFFDHSALQKMLPNLGPDVVGGSYCPLDGHVNSLRLFRAFHTALQLRGGTYLPDHGVTAITQADGGFSLTMPQGVVHAGKIVLAAGNANATLAPMVGLHAPMKPESGQIIVTERVKPFLRHPIVTLRQTDEGSVMIGDSREEDVNPADMTLDVNAVIASRAVRMFPKLANVNIVRSWRAIRVMPADGFPIYDQSTTHPGAFLVTCHSGVTLAAAHALELAPMIAAGTLDATRVGAFSSRRFHVSTAS
jgi:glycine/D-amino acid oxidase-like deaminating enzyme